MKRSDIKELHYITHIDNLRSILLYGILCHNKAKKIDYESVADEKIQKRREKVVIPGGKRKLHDYANLYFNARNPMMSKRKDNHKELCVLQIHHAVLDESNVIISDRNASSDYVRFYPSSSGLQNLDKSKIYADDWTHNNLLEYWIRKSTICAEVLVPGFVKPGFITGVYVSCQNTHQKVKRLLEGSPLAERIVMNPNLFFQEV